MKILLCTFIIGIFSILVGILVSEIVKVILL